MGGVQPAGLPEGLPGAPLRGVEGAYFKPGVADEGLNALQPHRPRRPQDAYPLHARQYYTSFSREITYNDTAMLGELAPIRRQYLRIKQQYPEAILFFRLGDFYETFEEDAKTASRVLEIALTSREMGKGHRLPMAGIPAQALEHYLAKLVSQGYKVAICEQLTPPGKGVVEGGGG